MKPRKERASIRRVRRWFFPKPSSRDKKNFFGWGRRPNRITIVPARRAIKTDNDSPKRSGTLTRKNSRPRNRALFTTHCFGRAKLVFMIESVFEPQVAGSLHPGQPVDVEFKSK